MNRSLKLLIVLVAIIVVLLLLGPFFVVQEGEQAVVTRFGRLVRTETQAGLKLRTPLIDTVTKYSKRILSWDGDPQRLPTSENQFIWVDTTARWRISDPAVYYESVNSLSQGYARLDDVIDSAVRTVIAQNPLSESVRSTNAILEAPPEEAAPAEVQEAVEEGETGPSFAETDETVFEEIRFGRPELSDRILAQASTLTPQYGIELLDVVIRQIRYSDDLTQSVYDRMIKERNRIAQGYRSYGEGKKAEWLGKLEREKRSILSGAYATSEEIKGTADAEAARIYSDAYSGANREFYNFWKALETYRTTLPTLDKVITTDPAYFRYLYDPEG